MVQGSLEPTLLWPDRDGAAPVFFRAPAEAVERRNAELEAENRALRAEAEHFRQLLDSARNYAIVTMNLGGRVTSWNAGARTILGYSGPEIIGRSGEIFFPAEDRLDGAFVKELCRAIDEGHATNERWHLRRDGTRFWASGAMMPLLDREGRARGFLNVFCDGTTTRAEEERRALLLTEMGRRVKNSLATAQAVAVQILRQTGVRQAVQTALTARLAALAQSHDLLIQGEWTGAPLAEVVGRALLPYGGPDRSTLAGPPIRLPGKLVERLGLTFHELATNAAKHGALSGPEGGVEVRWTLVQSEGGARLVEILWREHGGPPVTPPAAKGFGSRLLESGLAGEIGGTVRLDFPPEGLQCRISLPIIPESGEP